MKARAHLQPGQRPKLEGLHILPEGGIFYCEQSYVALDADSQDLGQKFLVVAPPPHPHL